MNMEVKWEKHGLPQVLMNYCYMFIYIWSKNESIEQCQIIYMEQILKNKEDDDGRVM